MPVDVPPELLNTTVAPPPVKLFPAASFAVKVAVIEEPEFTELEETETTEVVAEIAPGRTCNVGSEVVINVPPMVARNVVAVPATTPVKVAM